MKRLISFYAIAFGYSYIIWIIGILFFDSLSSTVVVSIGGLGPLIATFITYKKMMNNVEKKDFQKRLLKVGKNIGGIWLLAICSPFFLIIVASLISEGEIPNIDSSFSILYGVFLFVFGPIPEELAWRGIGFELLLRKGYVKAQLVVALLWMLWHVPLFFIDGSYQSNLGFMSISCFRFFINIFVISIITGAIYIKSGHSIPIAIVFHYVINLTGELFILNELGEYIYIIFLVLVASFCCLFIKKLESRRAIT